jgi:hypothetical protein
MCASQPFLYLYEVGMKNGLGRWLVFVIPAVFAVAAAAQDLQPEDDFQSWNDVQITVPLTPKLDFQTQLTGRFGKNVTRLNDGRFQVGVVLKPHKSFSITPYYWYIRARNAASSFRDEHRWNLRFTYRFPVKPFGVSHRSTLEYRVRGTAKSWRYRAGLSIEKDLKFIPKTKLVISDEVFYDSVPDRLSRNRFSVGINKAINNDLSLDLSYMRQNDGLSRPGNLNVIWTALRVKIGGK